MRYEVCTIHNMNIMKGSVGNTVLVKGNNPGPRIVIFGGEHGDETSGVHAIEKLTFDFISETRILTKGTLLFGRANEEAIAQGRRYIKHNLNRLYKDEYGPGIDTECYEYRRAQELKLLLRGCDYFLDLHSAPIAQEPFLVAEQKPAEFFRQIGISKVITGWSKFSDSLIGGDAEQYAARHGALAATLEAGSHHDPASISVAYNGAIHLLSTLDMLEPALQNVCTPAEIFDMYHLQSKNYEDFRYVNEPTNFAFIPQGSAYAFENNQPIIAPEDSYLMIPMKPEDIEIGEEVCYLGRKN